MPLGEAARLCPLITKREQIHKHTTSELVSFSSSGIREKEVLHVQFFIFSLPRSRSLDAKFFCFPTQAQQKQNLIRNRALSFFWKAACILN
jgi:hypothetical protein